MNSELSVLFLLFGIDHLACLIQFLKVLLQSLLFFILGQLNFLQFEADTKADVCIEDT